MKIVNQVGLEAEFILRDEKGKIRYPAKHGFGHDDFFILGEFRADPGRTREETVGNFMKALSGVIYKAQAKKLVVDFSGSWEIQPEFKAEILRKMASKQIAECKNIYGTDILKFSDDVVEDGKIKVCRISAGLHVHFSRWVFHEYEKSVGDKKSTVSEWLSILTPSQRRSIIVNMDNNILPHYDLGIPLKYRQKGFYEEKSWGFEYRSLPMVHDFTSIDKVMELVDFSFSQLEKLSK